MGGFGSVSKGWIYALHSENTPFVKIGLTTTSPAQRIKEINTDKNYGPLGPWSQLDVRQVKDVRQIETALHRKLAPNQVKSVLGTQELFKISTAEARIALSSIPQADLNRPTPINKLNLQPDFMSFLLALFRNSGLENFRDLKESWTFSLFPSTGGGRFFTLNIDRHEVALSRIPQKGDTEIWHAITVDEMAADDPQVRDWVFKNGGDFYETVYPSNWGNSVTVEFCATFDDSLTLFAITPFRRALIAYWYEALLRMQERQTRSLHARHHNYDATSEIFRHLRETKDFRTVLK